MVWLGSRYLIFKLRRHILRQNIGGGKMKSPLQLSSVTIPGNEAKKKETQSGQATMRNPNRKEHLLPCLQKREKNHRFEINSNQLKKREYTSDRVFFLLCDALVFAASTFSVRPLETAP